MNVISALRKVTGLSIGNFADTYRIPKRTIEDWLSERRTPPLYVIELLEYKVLDDLKRYSPEKINEYISLLPNDEAERVYYVITEEKEWSDLNLSSLK